MAYCKETYKKYYEANKDRCKEKSRAWYIRNKEIIERSGPEADLRKAKRREIAKRNRQKVRKEVLNLLGGKCCRCGFSDSRALQVDHVYGNGNMERAERSSSSVRGLLKSIKNAPVGEFQLLCANCNWIKRDENGEARGPLRYR